MRCTRMSSVNKETIVTSSNAKYYIKYFYYDAVAFGILRNNLRITKSRGYMIEHFQAETRNWFM